MNLPPFPVDEQTLSLLEIAIHNPDADRSSMIEFLLWMSTLGGVDVDAVESEDDNEFVQVVTYRDPTYCEHDVVLALISEIRQLRAASSFSG